MQLMASAAHRHVHLASETDVTGFRREARALLLAGVAPEESSWHVKGAAEADLFAVGDAEPSLFEPDPLPEARPTSASHATASALFVPAFFVPLCERALLHADPGRFGLLYRLLWRLVHEPALRHDPLDADRQQAELMARAVRRDMHKMTAFVRFRPIGASSPEEQPWHVAWFEPRNHIVEATAPFFARRFAQMRWSILTPRRCVRWDGRDLAFGPGARPQDAPAADAGEALWLTYYEHIFNPARLKLAMMQKEMPRRYWHNLPEAALIHPLTMKAAERSGQMVERPASEPAHRRPAASVALRVVPVESLIGAGVGENVANGVGNTMPPTLALLNQALEQCRHCPIGQHATRSVPGEGSPSARLMLVGEQPGDQEDLRGRPFVGPAGQLLDRALVQLGWPRDALYLTNAVKHFKYELRGKRRIHKTPAQSEAAACLQWLEREIELVQPQAAIALGATAARALLGRPVAVMSERGQWLQRDDGLRVLVTLHPSALLRLDAREREAAFTQWLGDLSAAAAFAPVPPASTPVAQQDPA
ncbi:UdgX family uracil-DNA binding protein [soil metagenome]